MTPHFRLSPQTRRLLELFLADPREWRYGYDLSRATDLKSGTLYPILMRLAKRHWLETRWETAPQPTGKPPRHLYRLTPSGLRWAKEFVERARAAGATHQPAFGGANA